MGGRVVVMLHGQPGSASDWQQLADRLPPGLRFVALDRPGYGANPLSAGGFVVNARAVVAELDTRGVERAVMVGHSYGAGVALSVAALAPERVEALVLLASVGPGCLTGWDRLLAAPVAGDVCALAAWWLTPWLARARLAAIGRLQRRPAAASEYVNWHIWGNAHHDHGPLWRSFLTEQRALVAELPGLAASLPHIGQPVLLMADPRDTLIRSRPLISLRQHCPMPALSSCPASATICPAAGRPRPRPRSSSSWRRWKGRRRRHDLALADTGPAGQLGIRSCSALSDVAERGRAEELDAAVLLGRGPHAAHVHGPGVDAPAVTGRDGLAGVPVERLAAAGRVQAQQPGAVGAGDLEGVRDAARGWRLQRWGSGPTRRGLAIAAADGHSGCRMGRRVASTDCNAADPQGRSASV